MLKMKKQLNIINVKYNLPHIFLTKKIDGIEINS